MIIIRMKLHVALYLTQGVEQREIWEYYGQCMRQGRFYVSLTLFFALAVNNV